MFLAKVERAIPVEPDKYYKKGQNADNMRVLAVSAGKTAFLDVEAKEVLTCNLKTFVYGSGYDTNII